MTTTDLDVGVRCNVDAEITEAGATTLPARRLFTIIRELPSSDVQFESDGKNVALHPQRPELFQNPRPAGRGIPAAAQVRGGEDLHPAPGRAQRRAQEDELRHLHRRDALRAQRHPVFVQGGQAHARRHGRPPLWRWWTWKSRSTAGDEASVIIPAKAINELAAIAQGRRRDRDPPRREPGGL